MNNTDDRDRKATSKMMNDEIFNCLTQTSQATYLMMKAYNIQ